MDVDASDWSDSDEIVIELDSDDGEDDDECNAS